MKILTNLYPHGKIGAITMSYDDGNIADKRLVEIFNKYGFKGTFHLNGGRVVTETVVAHEEYASLYKGHEVSCHMYTHPFPKNCPDTILVNEIMEDRRTLENACGYTVRGMSYPFGEYSDHAIDILRMCGMRYARTTAATNAFGLPEDFMKWHPTTHHKGDLKGLFDKFIAANAKYHRMNCLYIWGHSYEFDRENNWNIIEEFCEYASGRDDIWYATNIEIYDYVTACRNLFVSADGTMVYNPSNISVWVSADNNCVEIKPGENKLA